jgi:4-amino-4-deoxy-L-arabinose transferase-like glycosyltransferase
MDGTPLIRNQSNRIFNIIIILCLFVIIGRIFIWSWGILSQKMLVGDAALFAEMTRTFLDSTRKLYIDFWDHKPPVLYIFTASFVALFGTNTIAVQLAGLSEVLLFAYGIVRVVFYLTPEKPARAVALITATYYGLLIVYTRSIETTLLMTALGTIAISVCLTARSRPTRLILSGIIFACAIMAKQPVLTNAFVLPLAVISCSVIWGLGWNKSFRCLGYLEWKSSRAMEFCISQQCALFSGFK